MRPIEVKTDLAFAQALKCVDYRIPAVEKNKRSGYLLALALRYGLIGAAASHHLLLSSSDEEEGELLRGISEWPCVVADHFRWQTECRLPFVGTPVSAEQFGKLTYQPLVTYLALYRRLCPLDQSLRAATEEFRYEHLGEIREGWGWFSGGNGIRGFNKIAEDSIRFALMFFERRQHGLDEVPEIALLGE